MYDITIHRKKELVDIVCSFYRFDKNNLTFNSVVEENAGIQTTKVQESNTNLGSFSFRIPNIDNCLPKQFIFEIDRVEDSKVPSSFITLVYDFAELPEMPQLVIEIFNKKISEAHFENRNNGDSLGFKMIKQNSLKPEYIFVNEIDNSIISDKKQIEIIRNYIEAILKKRLNKKIMGIDNNLFTIYTTVLVQEELIEKAPQNLATNMLFCIPKIFNIENAGITELKDFVSNMQNMQENFIMTDHTIHHGGGHFVILEKDGSLQEILCFDPSGANIYDSNNTDHGLENFSDCNFLKVRAGNKKAEERFGQNLLKDIIVLVPNKSVIIENEYENCFAQSEEDGICGYLCAFFCSEIALYNNRKEIIDNFDKILFNTMVRTSELVDPEIGKFTPITKHARTDKYKDLYDKITLDREDYFLLRVDKLKNNDSCININCFKYIIGQKMFKTISTELQNFKTEGGQMNEIEKDLNQIFIGTISVLSNDKVKDEFKNEILSMLTCILSNKKMALEYLNKKENNNLKIRLTNVLSNIISKKGGKLPENESYVKNELKRLGLIQSNENSCYVV